MLPIVAGAVPVLVTRTKPLTSRMSLVVEPRVAVTVQLTVLGDGTGDVTLGVLVNDHDVSLCRHNAVSPPVRVTLACCASAGTDRAKTATAPTMRVGFIERFLWYEIRDAAGGWPRATLLESEGHPRGGCALRCHGGHRTLE